MEKMRTPVNNTRLPGERNYPEILRRTIQKTVAGITPQNASLRPWMDGSAGMQEDTRVVEQVLAPGNIVSLHVLLRTHELSTIVAEISSRLDDRLTSIDQTKIFSPYLNASDKVVSLTSIVTQMKIIEKQQPHQPPFKIIYDLAASYNIEFSNRSQVEVENILMAYYTSLHEKITPDGVLLLQLEDQVDGQIPDEGQKIANYNALVIESASRSGFALAPDHYPYIRQGDNTTGKLYVFSQHTDTLSPDTVKSDSATILSQVEQIIRQPVPSTRR